MKKIKSFFDEFDEEKKNFYKRIEDELKPNFQGKYILCYGLDKKYLYNGIITDLKISDDEFNNMRIHFKTETGNCFLTKNDYIKKQEKIIFFDTEEEARLFVEVQ